MLHARQAIRAPDVYPLKEANVQNEEALTKAIARNIAALRKKAGLTQTQLAEKINYSDKSVSKWERGEGVPDVIVLAKFAELFRVSLDELCGEKPPEKAQKKDRRRGLVFLLSEGLVWLVATVFFTAFKLFSLPWPDMWLIFVYAVTASSIVGVVFTAMWFPWYAELAAITALVWSIPVSISLSAPHPQSYMLFIVAAVVQVLFFFWFWLKIERHKVKKTADESDDGKDAGGVAP